MSGIPPSWASRTGYQRIVGQEVNPVLQGYVFPRYSSAPTGTQGLCYFDTTKVKPGWYGAAWTYPVSEDASGNVDLAGTLDVTGAVVLDSTLSVAGNTVLSGTLGVSGTATLSGSLSVASNTILGGTLSVAGTTSVAAISTAALTASGNLLTSANLGFATGAGGTVTQGTSRTTAVTNNNRCGTITLVSAAGSTSWQTFRVNCTVCQVKDIPHVVQASGTDDYMIHVSDVRSGSFDVTFATTGGTTTEQPVFNFCIIKGAA